MPLPLAGVEHIGAGRELMPSAKTAEELRRAQAILLPLDVELRLEQTAVGHWSFGECHRRDADTLPSENLT